MKNDIEKKNKKVEKFYLLNDKIVKKIFTSDEELGKKVILRILSNILKIPVKKLDDDFEIVYPEIGLNKYNINSEADLVYKNKKAYFSFEFNYNNYQSLLNKNFSYVCLLYVKDIKNKEDYSNIKEVYSINIDGFDYYGYDEFIYESEMRERKIGIPLGIKIKYYNINLAYLKKMGYNDIIKEKDFIKRLMYMFVCNDEEFLDKLYEGDEMMNAFRKKVNDVLENIDVLMYYDRDKLLREGAYDDGLTHGKEEGIEVGEKKKSLEIAKNLINQKINIDIISKVTGLPKEEIKTLQGAI